MIIKPKEKYEKIYNKIKYIIRGSIDINYIISSIVFFFETKNKKIYKNKDKYRNINKFKTTLYILNKYFDLKPLSQGQRAPELKILNELLQIIIENKLEEPPNEYYFTLDKKLKFLIKLFSFDTLIQYIVLILNSYIYNVNNVNNVNNFIYYLFILNYLEHNISYIFIIKNKKYYKIKNIRFLDLIKYLDNDTELYSILDEYRYCSYIRYLWIKLTFYNKLKIINK